MLPNGPKLLTVREVAAALRVSIPTIYRWVATGSLPSIRYGQESVADEQKRGGAIRIPESAVTPLLVPTYAGEEVA
ncbi:helix-turn-helix domain-containing protein [Streptomyces sp. NPDC059994]|uniref:helix-turn-helix domain-containing protein n=1 Tax=Streptomyces sp. NPDC059994 TaxID=3347029 RepID=UPI0036B5671D